MCIFALSLSTSLSVSIYLYKYIYVFLSMCIYICIRNSRDAPYGDIGNCAHSGDKISWRFCPQSGINCNYAHYEDKISSWCCLQSGRNCNCLCPHRGVAGKSTWRPLWRQNQLEILSPKAAPATFLGLFICFDFPLFPCASLEASTFFPGVAEPVS